MKRLISNLRRRDLPHYSSDLEEVPAVKKLFWRQMQAERCLKLIMRLAAIFPSQKPLRKAVI